MNKDQYFSEDEWNEEESMKIDWVCLFVKLIKGWRFIAFSGAFFLIFGIIVALSMTKQYTVSVTLAPESQGKSGSGALSGMANMLGIGTALPNNADALNVSLFPDICYSTPFLVQLMDVEVTPYVSSKERKKGLPSASPTTLTKFIFKDGAKKSYLGRLKEAVRGGVDNNVSDDSIRKGQLSALQWQMVKILRKMVYADVDKKTGMIKVGVTMSDPWIATSLADTVCSRLQDYVITYRTSKQQEDLDYYLKLEADAKEKMIKAQTAYALSVDYDRSVILQSVSSEKERLQQEAQLASQLYTQMAQQVEMAKARLQEVKPVYTVLQPAVMPEDPSSTSRKAVVLAFFLCGICLSSAWKLFGVDFYHGIKAEFIAKMNTENIENAQEANESLK